MPKRLTDIEIAVRVVPTMLRWPEIDMNTAWSQLHEAVQQLRELARAVDADCIEIEQNRTLPADVIARQRTRIGQVALEKLGNFRAVNIAEQTVAKEIRDLEKAEGLQAVRGKQMLLRALNELRAGIAATRRLVLERCEGSTLRLKYY